MDTQHLLLKLDDESRDGLRSHVYLQTHEAKKLVDHVKSIERAMADLLRLIYERKGEVPTAV